jgi:predicted nucleotidyltransferase component of viral defense system
MSARRYATPSQFKEALEARLSKKAQAAGVKIEHVRQRFVFERFLARLAAHFGDRVVLKGGVALSLRLPGARVTRDVDVRLSGNADHFLVEIRSAVQVTHDADFLAFTVEPDAHHPTIEAEGMKYGGRRFRVAAALAGKVYGTRFGVDVAVGDRMTRPPEIITGSDFLEFVSIPRVQIHAYAREAHLAEKLHALTAVRARVNTRVKDLPDLALLAMTGPFESRAVREAIHATFTLRSTHLPPTAIAAPPESWRVPYARMAQENALRWASLDGVLAAVRSFLDPVLRGEDGVWDPDTWSWRGED